MTDRLPILVVDDDSQMLRTIGDILRFKGYETIPAASGAEGLRQAQAHEQSLAIALVDLRLPDMDGMELVSHLRAFSPNVEVLILTGHATIDSAVRALREHSYDYLTKPVAPDHLVATIAQAGDRWQRRRAEQALEESEQRLRRMFECVSDAVFITDDDRRIMDANPAALALAGRDLEALHGERVDALLQPSLRKLDIRSARFAPGMHVHSVRDLSEQRRLEAALHHAQKMEAIGRLAGGIAHDFNNLLTVISGFTSLMLSSRTPDDPDYRLLDEIARAAQSGATLTRQLLTFGRKQALQPRVLDPNDAIHAIEGMLARLVGDDVTVHTALADDVHTVFADPGQIEQVLMNLVANARDAMPQGGTLSITSANVAIEGMTYVRLTVSDTGVGMPPEVVERAFEPFFTTKDEGKGTGLGLATVHGIIEQSGGFIRLDSVVGKGTTFSIHLPRHKPAPDTPASPS